MQRQFKISLAAVLIGAAVTLATVMAYLLRQGVDEASQWATYLGLPLTVITAATAVWTTVLATQAAHKPRHSGPAGPAADGGAQPRATVSRTGSIRQENIRGSAISHTGTGDITFTASAPHEPPDEQA